MHEDLVANWHYSRTFSTGGACVYLENFNFYSKKGVLKVIFGNTCFVLFIDNSKNDDT